MAITQRIDEESQTFLLKASGYVDWEERQTVLNSFRESFASGRIKYALIDLRDVTADNDARAEIEFGKLMAETLSGIGEIRTAVLLSEEFLVTSSAVLRMQQSGMDILDFRNEKEAKAWLYGD